MAEELATRVVEAPTVPQVASQPETPLSDHTSTHNALYQMFSAEKSERVETAFKMIWEYATEQAESKDYDSIKLEVIRLKNRLGSPHIGEPSYAKLERYVSAINNLRKAQSIVDEVSK